MYQEFDQSRRVHINRDDRGVARELLHTDEHVVSQAPTAQLAAQDYLNRYGSLLDVAPSETRNLALVAQPEAIDAGGELRFDAEKRNMDMTTVVYRQTHFGLPVWHGGVAIHMKGKPYRVISSQSTRHPDLDVERPAADVLARLKAIDAATLCRQLGLSATDAYFDPASLAIEHVKLIIYRYEAKKRARQDGQAHDHGSADFVHFHPTLPLPPPADNIQEGHHYVAAEVNFALAQRGRSPIHWVAIVEAETLSVLYLRAFVDSVQGQVFAVEPMTTNNGPAPSATAASLDPVRVAVPLQGLVSGSPQHLTGDIIKLADVELPSPIAPPTEPNGADFTFSSRTNDFAAVNAYYHCDGFFRLLQDLGFSLSTFFGTGTTFPSTVDHRGFAPDDDPTGSVINAHCVGTSGGKGILQTTFALADLTDLAHPLGIACDYRVVLHELGGHGVLYPHVHSPNFGFAHSAGDSVAAITCDPDSKAADRFLTFPWVNIGRRHDRTPAAGWGWSGSIALNPFDFTLDRAGYKNEQILSTTMFRFYLSIGGGSTSLATRQFASRYAVYLILRAISTLTPATNPSNAAGFATALITADSFDWTSEGQTGGAYGKVIRWAFEKQGLYQPAGTPVPNNNVGAPPAVDVYVDDGRHGEYQYQAVCWNNQNIWNRRHADGGTTHEQPLLGQKNFAYVRIKNRGSQLATGVTVKGYHANPAAGLVYPNDWHPMTTAQLAAADVPANNASVITVGPFEWTPTVPGHECLFMVVSANGDPSNVSNLAPGESIPEWRLVPNDNNIGWRNMFPVAGAGGSKGLLATLDGAKIVIKNPHREEAKTVVQAVLPAFLAKAGWTALFDNPGGGAFALRAGESKTVALRLKPGKEFSADDVKAARDAEIRVEAYANGILVGGMTYTLDPAMRGPEATGLTRAAVKTPARAKAGGGRKTKR